MEEVLFDACREGDLKKVVSLVEEGVDIHAEYNKAITNACVYGHLKIVKYLVENGADTVNDILIFAVGFDRLDIVEYLVEKGVDIHSREDCNLIAACDQVCLDNP